MVIITFDRVTYADHDKKILEDIQFEVEKGDFLSIVGPSGSGKSTLLRLASQLISPTSGNIYFHQKNMKEMDPIMIRQKISYGFQSPQLFGKTVRDDMAFPYHIRKIESDSKRISFLFDLFQMDRTYLDKEITKLSGGEKQRIALIRQLLFEPEIILLDEVTSALDAENTKLVENILSQFNQT
ncbi:ABC transporter, ATP-binding protein [Streptococcus ictaluri 707-05]|uniref:ABC transporter, ATP-binding protein n=1 Tax=Streptococcus ictaluri 707-05 TaxID=764299 RepID=G5K651_9STRE|nr:ABC transporter, ATP-binding protein [Streptococcus ictaluri 707-05]